MQGQGLDSGVTGCPRTRVNIVNLGPTPADPTGIRPQNLPCKAPAFQRNLAGFHAPFEVTVGMSNADCEPRQTTENNMQERDQPILLDAGNFVLANDEVERIAAAGIEFAYLVPHEMPDSDYRVFTIPVN